jgi:hypothetical protein
MRREVADVFIVAAQTAIQPSFPVAMVFFKPEIVRMLYAMWQGSPWLFKMTP